MHAATTIAAALALSVSGTRAIEPGPPAGSLYSARIWGVGGPVRAERTERLGILLRDPRGRLVRDLLEEHEKPLHAILVRSDLGWFEHIHPESTGVGTFEASVRFPGDGQYAVFLDFATPSDGPQVVRVPLAVGSGRQGAGEVFDPGGDEVREREIDGYTVRLEAGGAIEAGAAARLRYIVERDGEPLAEFEPYLGARAHLVVIGADVETFRHAHALGSHEEGADQQDEHAGHECHGQHAHHERAPQPHTGHAPGAMAVEPGTLEFDVRVEAPGVYRAWAQFQHEGRVITAPFTINVRAAGEPD